MRRIACLLIMALVVAACQPADEGELPTVAVLPSSTPTNTAPPPTEIPTETQTPSPTETPTETLTPSITPTPTNTVPPTATPNETQIAVGTATNAVMEAPRFATLTPLPAGAGAIAVVVRPTSTGTPEIIADVVITPRQLQEELDRILEGAQGISRTRVSLAPEEGVQVELTALSEGIFVTGTFIVPFRLSGSSINNVLIIGGETDFVMQNAAVEPSEEYVTSALTVVVPAVQEAFNDILNQRLGEGNHDLEQLLIEENQIGILLYVPDPGT